MFKIDIPFELILALAIILIVILVGAWRIFVVGPFKRRIMRLNEYEFTSFGTQDRYWWKFFKSDEEMKTSRDFRIADVVERIHPGRERLKGYGT